MLKINKEKFLKQVNKKNNSLESLFITNANLKRLASILIPPFNKKIEDVFQSLPTEKIKELYNSKELQQFITLELLISGNIINIKLKENSYYSSSFIFKLSSPKFHSTYKCNFMQSDFINYEIPLEISNLGPEKVSEFQIFCTEQLKNYKNPEEMFNSQAFWTRVTVKFKTGKISIPPLKFNNSGYSEVENLSELGLKELINRLLDELTGLIENSQYSSLLTGKRYSPSLKKALFSINCEKEQAAINDFFEKKILLSNIFFNYFLKKNGKTAIDLPQSILAKAGFAPCKACC